MKEFSKSEALRSGWDITKAHLGLFVGVMIILGMLRLMIDVTNSQAQQRKVYKEDFSAVTTDVDRLYEDLIQNGYITADGVIRHKFTDMNDVRQMVLGADFVDQRMDIVRIFFKALRRVPPSRYKFYGLTLILWIINLIAQIGFLKIALKIYDGETASIQELFSYARFSVRYFLASFLYGIMVLVGLLLLVVPGVFWSIKYQMFAFLILDRDMGIWESFKKSSELTSGVKLSLFVFVIILGGINLAGALCFLVGLLVTVPVTLMAYIHVYRLLLSEAEPAVA